MTLAEYQRISPVFDESVFSCLTIENAVNAKSSYGGTAEKMVLKQLADIEGRSDA